MQPVQSSTFGAGHSVGALRTTAPNVSSGVSHFWKGVLLAVVCVSFILFTGHYMPQTSQVIANIFSKLSLLQHENMQLSNELQHVRKELERAQTQQSKACIPNDILQQENKQLRDELELIRKNVERAQTLRANEENEDMSDNVQVLQRENKQLHKKLVHVRGEYDRLLKISRMPSRHSPVLSVLKRVCTREAVSKVVPSLVSTSPENSTVIDIGLAHGRECFGVASMGRTCQGFEADPYHARLLQKRIVEEKIKNAYVKAAAVGSTNGIVHFARDVMNQHGVGGTLTIKAHDQTKEVVKTEMVTLDSQFPSAKAERIFLVKSDTQGHELEVLEGAQQLLKERRVQFILLEMSIYLMPRPEKDARKIMNILDEAGFFCLDLPWHKPAGAPCDDFRVSNNNRQWV